MKKQILFWLVSLMIISHLSFAQFAKGADIGWLSEMEARGRKFYDKNGVQKDLLDILKEYNINSIRLRVWVNPSNGYCNKADVITQALRAKNKGFRVMIDFHYSDSWADPGQQNKPSAWTNYNFAQLRQAVATHTSDVLTGIKNAGVTPEWVQVGNETNNGMLWEDGRASTNMSNFAQLVTSGYDAVKSVFPTAKVIVHISNGYDNGLFRWMFDGLRNNNAKWDVIAVSMYPEQNVANRTWQTINPQCLANLNDMVARYGKEVIVAEIGMPWSDANASFDFIKDIIAKTRSVNQSKGLGVFYWEPQSYYGWNGYHKGAFDDSGKPTRAMDAFLEGAQPSVPVISISSPSNNSTICAGVPTLIAAQASVSTGSITKVDFYDGTILLGTDLSSPYDLSWNFSSGNHSITAVATSSDHTSSALSTITVTAQNTPAAPVVTSPVTYCQDEAATALTVQGTGLKWYSLQTGGQSSTLSPMPNTSIVGLTTHYVSQTLNNCESARSPLAVYINPKPLINITSPSPNVKLIAPAHVPIATHTSGDNITRVEFYNGSEKLGEDVSAPYTYTMLNLSPSIYTIITKVFSSSGCSSLAHVVITVDVPTENNDVKLSNEEVFPNPFQNNATIRHAEHFQYQIYNANGIEVENGEGKDVHHIGAALKPGIYLLEIKTSTTSHTYKITKSN